MDNWLSWLKCLLWFDVERRYKTISTLADCTGFGLWFDVERRYKTMIVYMDILILSCGLM